MAKKKVKLDKFHYHEALDRCHVVCSMIDDHLLDHPVIDQSKPLKKKILRAQVLISEVYQKLGSK